MSRKNQETSRKHKAPKPVKYYRDGELVGDVIPLKREDGAVELFRMVMVFCPDDLLEEIDTLSEFNFIERSDFVTVAAQQLFDYLDAHGGETALAFPPAPMLDGESVDDILMSPERYPYEEEDDDGCLWCAEDEEDEYGGEGGDD